MGFLDTKQVCKAELLKVNSINTKLEEIIRGVDGEDPPRAFSFRQARRRFLVQ